MKSCFDGEKKTTYIVKYITNIFALVNFALQKTK